MKELVLTNHHDLAGIDLLDRDDRGGGHRRQVLTLGVISAVCG